MQGDKEKKYGIDEEMHPIYYEGKYQWGKFPRLQRGIINSPTEFMSLSKVICVKRVDDSMYKIQTTFLWPYLVIAGICLVVYLFVVGLHFPWHFEELKYVVFTYIFGILSVSTLMYGLITPRKYLVLDRMQGMISLPPRFWGKPVTAPFNNCIGVITGGRGINNALEVWPNDKRIRGGIVLNINDLPTLIQYWSLLVWYMDTNRPLPPCDELDTYCLRDYERRKQEGFPPPLYPSCIDTPEATPEQQKERDAVWSEKIWHEN